MFVTTLPHTEKGTQSTQKGRYCAIKADIGKNNNAKQAKAILFGFFKYFLLHSAFHISAFS